MVELRKGMLAKSKAGHDAGKVFVIKQADSEYVYQWMAAAGRWTIQRKRKESIFR